MDRPRQSFRGLWNISFGFFGIQIGFALQNANASRIFQSLGTPLESLGLMWVAAPLTGLLVQPVVGYYSDRTWGWLGRRRPYFLAGSILAALALIVMPDSPAIWVAALTLWLLDASLNVSMEPFRAFVGDMVGKQQRPAGYAFQTAFIGAGGVVASLAPWVLEHWFHVANIANAGHVPDTVRYSFRFGGLTLLAAVLWTVFSTHEYSPEEMRAFGEDAGKQHEGGAIVATTRGPLWIASGLALGALIWLTQRNGYLASANEAWFVAVGIAVYGAAQAVSRALVASGRGDNLLSHIISDLTTMPDTMRRLALVQFFTWGALIIMWVYTTPVVARHIYGSADPTTEAYNQAANWVGVLFAIYGGVAAVAAFLLPPLARAIGAARTHMICLAIGAVAFLSMMLLRDARALVVPMVAIGLAWASILTMPYVILANALPQRKLGIYMGIFNFFIVLPQLIVATIMGGVIKNWFPGQPQWTMLIAAVVMATASLLMLRVATPADG